MLTLELEKCTQISVHTFHLEKVEKGKYMKSKEL